jgi:hypothetical protein
VDHLKPGDPVKLNNQDKFNKANEWTIYDVYDVSTGLIGEGKTLDGNLNRVQICLGILYVNESRKQLVLAHKSIEADWKSVFSSVSGLSNTLDGILQNKIVPQLYACYEMTRIANEIAKEQKCFLSFTGFASGAWLAEHSVYYSHLDFKNTMTKGVLFESPGMVTTKEEFMRRGIINDESRGKGWRNSTGRGRPSRKTGVPLIGESLILDQKQYVRIRIG